MLGVISYGLEMCHNPHEEDKLILNVMLYYMLRSRLIFAI